MKSKVRFQLFIIPAVLLLVCAAALSLPRVSSSTAKAASVPVHHGVDRMGTEYQCTKTVATLGTSTDFDGPVDQASVNAMKTWDINIVRVPLNEDCWLGINGFPANGKTAAQYQSDIVNWVNLLLSNGMTVILDLHWNNGGTNQSTGQEMMPDSDHAPAFWTSVASTAAFKSNASVYFDLYNEPHDVSWSCWLNGGSACSGVSFPVAGMQTLVNTVRATGATNLLMLGGLAWSNDLSGWLANEPTDPLNNLAASVHVYNFNACSNSSCWDSTIAPVAAKVPVIAGEIGENDCASTFVNTLTTWFDQHNISYLGWTWTVANCSSTPALISDYTGTPTNFGAGYKAHLLSLGGGVTSTPTTPTSTPTLPPTTTTTPTSTPTLPPTTTTTPVSGGGCSVHYSVNQWQGGFTGSVTINNTSSSAINGWTLAFTFPGNQQITQVWNATETQSGAQVTAKNLSYNGSIPAAGSTSFGFNGSWSGSNPSPTAFTLNGTACTVA